MTRELWSVRLEHDGDVYGVRSALTPAPMPGDRIRYGNALELVVTGRVVAVGVTDNPVVECELGDVDLDVGVTVSDALRRLRFRRLEDGTR